MISISPIKFLDMINYKIEVKGNVQGVGYRYAAYQKANLLGVKGTVQNLEDGSVVIKASAKPEKMKSFVNWCQVGPDAAKVANVNTVEISNMDVNEFKIVR